MAWPKLKNRRSQDEEVTLGNEGGTTPEGARWQPVASDVAAKGRTRFSRAASGSPVNGGTDAGSGSDSGSGSGSDSGDVEFWEWSKSNESFDLNDPDPG